MKRKLSFAGLSLFTSLSLLVSALAAVSLPTIASAATAYTAIIRVENNGTSLGYVADDPNYYTPLLTPDPNSALVVGFTLANDNTGTEINLTHAPLKGFTNLGPVVGRDSTTPDIAAGSFNYLYLTPSTPTAANATPQLVPNYFSVNSGLAKPGETAVWNVDVPALTLALQWVNSDGSKPTTVTWVQSNHLYAGGDSAAFMARFPAPVTNVTLHLVIQSSVPVVVDADGDGVPDGSDQCPNTARNDVVNSTGCSIAQLCPCANNWKNHGQYVSCVSRTADAFANSGLITGPAKDAIVSQAARSSCGH